MHEFLPNGCTSRAQYQPPRASRCRRSANRRSLRQLGRTWQRPRLTRVFSKLSRRCVVRLHRHVALFTAAEPVLASYAEPVLTLYTEPVLTLNQCWHRTLNQCYFRCKISGLTERSNLLRSRVHGCGSEDRGRPKPIPTMRSESLWRRWCIKLRSRARAIQPSGARKMGECG